MFHWSRSRFAVFCAVSAAIMILVSPAPAYVQPNLAISSAGAAGSDLKGGAGSAADLLASKVEAALLDELSVSRRADFWVNFDDLPDLSPAAHMDWSERGWFVYEKLTEAAARSQAQAQLLLDGAGAEYKSFWIANTIYVEGGDMALLTDLAFMPQVSEVVADGSVPLVEPVEQITEGPAEESIPWGVIDTRAPDLWDYGVTGDGIIVGSIDTGVQYNHPALAARSSPKCGVNSIPPNTGCR